MALLVRSWVVAQHPLASVLPKEWASDCTCDYISFLRVTNLPVIKCRKIYTELDLEQSYSHLFELMWYSQMPCFDILNVTTKADQNHGKRLCTL